MSIEDVRGGIEQALEQAVLVSVGAASLTRERAETAVADLVRRGQMGSEDGRKAVERLMGRVRGAGAGAGEGLDGLTGRLEGGVQGVLREVGVATRGELEDLGQRLAELEHRIALLEGGTGAATESTQGDSGD